MKANFNISWTTCLLLALIAFTAVRSHNSIKTLKAQVALLELANQTTVEIQVERAFDADMGVYDYQLVGKAVNRNGKAITKIKRGRKRMSQLRENY